MRAVIGSVLDVAIRKQLPGFALDVHLETTSGITVIFGPSGSGKSLTLRMIAGLETPDQGWIRIGGRTVFDSDQRITIDPQERRIGYVPQQYAIFPHLSAIENVAFPLQKGPQHLDRPAAMERARSLLDTFGLAERADARPRELSGGQLQRIAFARALATDPAVLLLDEPFAALDAPVRSELRRELRTFQRQLHVPVVFITHDIEEAATLADELAVMIDGRLRQSGSTRAILDHPADRRVAELVQSRNILEGMTRKTNCSVTIETPVGALNTGTHPVPEGMQAVAVIRPEVIRILREDRDTSRLADANVLEGTILDIADHGTRTAVVTQVQEGQLEVSLSPTAAANLQLVPGSAIRLAIPPANIHLIKESS